MAPIRRGARRIHDRELELARTGKERAAHGHPALEIDDLRHLCMERLWQSGDKQTKHEKDAGA